MQFFFNTLIQWRKFIIVCGLAGAVVMGVLAFILPSWYTATTSIFPPEPAVGMPGYAEIVQQLSAPLLGPVASGAAPETINIEMLKSRSICERVIQEFDLMKSYKADYIEDAIAAMHSHMGFTLLDNGLLILTFEDKNPERAAQIANRLVDLLDETTRGLKISRAGRTRQFVEKQLVEREKLLAQAEDDMKAFQLAHNTLDLDEQLRSAMDIITSLSARAIAIETEMQIMSHYTVTTSEEYQRKKTEYQEVVGQLRKLKATNTSTDEDLVRSFIPTLRDVPEVALQYLRLRRAVEVQNTVYTMLVNEHERSRIEEARDTPVVQVLDRAHAPNLRSRPQRKFLVLAGGLIGMGWSVAAALLVTAWREDRGNTAAARKLLGPLAADIARLRRRKQS